MPDIGTFFRHCPSCGRRFELRLVSKEEVSSEDIEGEEPSTTKAIIAAETMTPAFAPEMGARAYLADGIPTIVDVEEFRYQYKCKHCGHEWVELRAKDSSADAPKGYQSD